MIYQLWIQNAIIISEYLHTTKLDMKVIILTHFLFRSEVLKVSNQLRMCPLRETPLRYGKI
jgi:hypothetical protein